jgi:hypothetical protein
MSEGERDAATIVLGTIDRQDICLSHWPADTLDDPPPKEDQISISISPSRLLDGEQMWETVLDLKPHEARVLHYALGLMIARIRNDETAA